jgi:RloB-like protein
VAISRLKRPLTRAAGVLRDASLFIIATEGEKTEPLYFEAFQSQRLKTIPIPCEDGKSSPEAVLIRIDEYKKKYDFGNGDSFWLVIDRDKWPEKTLSAVASECRKKQFTLIVSNPYFEVWIAQHFADELPLPLTKRSMQKHLKDKLGSFSKTKYDVEALHKLCPDACTRAKEMDLGENEIWPDNPGSRVYLLVENILTKI